MSLSTSSAVSRASLEPAEALPCVTCGYDLRVHPRGGICPECASPVEKAIELAKIPVRPLWHASDPRWCRRMLAGAWLLVLVPLYNVLEATRLDEKIPIPSPYPFAGSPATLAESAVGMVYAYLVFCTGIVLFFSKERGRQPHRLDWTRRWGVFGSYTVAVTGLSTFGVITSLVLIGIAATFMSLPAQNQPAVTGLFANIGAGYIYYGPDNENAEGILLPILSTCVVLLACVPIYRAMRSSGPAWMAWVVVAVIVSASLWTIQRVVIDALRGGPAGGWFWPAYFFFQPEVMVSAASRAVFGFTLAARVGYAIEVLKWLCFLTIALWLTAAQVRAMLRPTSGGGRLTKRLRLGDAETQASTPVGR